MHTDYRSPIVNQLRDQLVRFAPREKKLEQINRAEKLLGELQPEKDYTYEYLCFRLTDFRPTSFPNHRLSGEDAAHDLRLFVEDLSDAAGVAVEDVSEPVLTVEQLSKALNVSTKTIARWRRQGLVSRRFVYDGRKRLGFLKSSVDHFVSSNPERVQRGRQFSHMSDEERSDIVQRARRLASAGGCPAEITRRLAETMDRSVETIRYTIRQFDDANPDLAIFPDHSKPLGEQMKGRIFQQFRRGTSAEALAKQYCRTKTSIYRVINEMRARRILELPLDYMPNDDFRRRNAEARILAPLPEPETATKKPRVPKGLPPYLASLYEVPLLTREQEVHLFRKFNYLKYRASKLREKLDPARATRGLMNEIEQFYNEAVAVKNQIVQANLRLVVSIAKRHVDSADDFFELVSDGNMSLIRAVEKFDYGRGNKFSTYASWAIMKNFARTIPSEFKHKDRFRTAQDEMFAATPEVRGNQFLEENEQQRRESQIELILDRLDEREQKIIISRYGLDHAQEPLTLKEVGEEMGVTKERVRQIEVRALNKLRMAAQEANIEVPD